MNIKLTYTALLFFCIGLASCETCGGKHDTFYADVEKAKSAYPDSLVNHIPIRFCNFTALSSSEASKYTAMKLVVEQDYKTEVLDTIIAFAKSNAIASYSASDSCLFVVNRYAHYSSNGTLYNSFTESLERASSCESNYLPIPNFYNREDKTRSTPSQLKKEFQLYILSAGQIQIGEEQSNKWERYLPTEWKNGYSRGIAINTKTNKVLYWVSTW